MSLEIRTGSFEETKHLHSAGKKERVTFANPLESVWWVAELDGKVVGCVCAVIKPPKARFKSDFVSEEFRHQGIYRQLFKARFLYALKHGAKNVSAFCTKLSKPTYYRYGFTQKSIRNGISFMTWPNSPK